MDRQFVAIYLCLLLLITSPLASVLSLPSANQDASSASSSSSASSPSSSSSSSPSSSSSSSNPASSSPSSSSSSSSPSSSASSSSAVPSQSSSAAAGAGRVAVVVSKQLQMPKVIPMVVNLCKTTCPNICHTIHNFCQSIPGMLNCDDLQTECLGLCTDMCTCINQCGPNCDVFETNCLAVGVPAVGGVFCPMVEGSCNIGCVVGCPQKMFLDLLVEVLSNVGIAINGGLGLILKPVLAGLNVQVAQQSPPST